MVVLLHERCQFWCEDFRQDHQLEQAAQGGPGDHLGALVTALSSCNTQGGRGSSGDYHPRLRGPSLCGSYDIKPLYHNVPSETLVTRMRRMDNLSAHIDAAVSSVRAGLYSPSSYSCVPHCKQAWHTVCGRCLSLARRWRRTCVAWAL